MIYNNYNYCIAQGTLLNAPWDLGRKHKKEWRYIYIYIHN